MVVKRALECLDVELSEAGRPILLGEMAVAAVVRAVGLAGRSGALP
ncbi:hypothetical protein R4P70_21415 [Rhodococcus sp. IEGM 1241]|nr:hypothetical protein [Rhodococcus sp. IEGM 1241]MDV8013880.1 hypothetical protein [Rhodococcus sp. IEGM 1241]